MSSYYRAVAIDFDGTLTERGPPSRDVLASLLEVRKAGRKVVLVTGRVLSDLLRMFPEAEDYFDAIVAENGAVIRQGQISRALTAPVPLELDEPLVRSGVHFQRGQVLLACWSRDEIRVLQEVRRLGADCHLVPNRDALMLLPSGVSKGSGLLAALERLGVSYHSTIGIGDAENDLALFRQCELGVAVSNAVESLKRFADIVLSSRGGDAVAEFLRKRVLGDEPLPSSRRWQVSFGQAEEGRGVRLPASQTNLLVLGGSGVGKSYAAGLFAERLIELNYSVCVLDPEGDHVPLGNLPNVLTVGGRGGLPAPELIPELLRPSLGSVVVDLSLSRDSDIGAYMVDVLSALREEREQTGLPHWILVDEAHESFGQRDAACEAFRGEKGICLVTYNPSELRGLETLDFDYLVVIPGESGIEPRIQDAAQQLWPMADLGAARSIDKGRALFVRLVDPPSVEVFTLDRRLVKHIRHWHKYAESHLAADRAFRFRTLFGPTGAQADNLAAFRRELRLCETGVLEHHAAHHDFSKWLLDEIHDETLSRVAFELEERTTKSEPTIEHLRAGLVEAIENRYLA